MTLVHVLAVLCAVLLLAALTVIAVGVRDATRCEQEKACLREDYVKVCRSARELADQCRLLNAEQQAAISQAEHWAAALVDHVNPTVPAGGDPYFIRHLNTPSEQSRRLSSEARDWLASRGTSAKDVLARASGKQPTSLIGAPPRL